MTIESLQLYRYSAHETGHPTPADLKVKWSIMKQKVVAHYSISEVDLRRLLKQVWMTEVTPEHCKVLVHSMLSCIEAILKNKGFTHKTLTSD